MGIGRIVLAIAEYSDNWRSCRVRTFGISSEKVWTDRSLGGHSEVAFDISPAAMNVIGGIAGGIGLHVEKLDYKGRPLYPIGVLVSVFRTAGIGEVHLSQAGVFCFLQFH